MARRHFAIVALLLAAAAPLRAQSMAPALAPAPAPAPSAPAAVAAPAPQAVSFAPATTGPSYGAMSVAAHAPASANTLVTSPAVRGDVGQAKAMMIVGAAAFLAGAVIGDTPGTIIMVGGAVVGLVGLYEYLQ